MTEPPVVRVENAEKVYKLGTVSVHALRGVSMEAVKGEFIVIMGASGSGKTTLLNLIGALDQPTTGKIFIDGKDLTTSKEGELVNIRRNKIGYVFQFYNLIPVLTALENVELPMLIAGLPKNEREQRARELLELVGLGHRSSHRPDELSGGEQQRVAIARALSNRPSIILADEPTGDLDTKSGNEVMIILRELTRKEGVTVITVTHDPIVSQLANRILQIQDGKIVGEKKLRIPENARAPATAKRSDEIESTVTAQTFEKEKPLETRATTSRISLPGLGNLPSVGSLSMMTLGSVIMAWVMWLTWYDMTFWSRDFVNVFLGPRTGEALSLGIDMRILYYFLIGLALLLLGLIAYRSRRLAQFATKRGKERDVGTQTSARGKA